MSKFRIIKDGNNSYFVQKQLDMSWYNCKEVDTLEYAESVLQQLINAEKITIIKEIDTDEQ